MTKEVEVVPEGLLKIKQILDAILQRLSLNPESQTFEFELGGFHLNIKNENNYLELLDILKGLKIKAGIEYEINDSYTDHRGRKQSITLYDSYKCKVKIVDPDKFANYKEEISERCQNSSVAKQTGVIKEDNLLLIKDLKAIATANKLIAYSDGTVRYGKNILRMRNQLKDLCRLFMRNQDRLLTIDDIKDEIVRADRRSLTSFATIAKYVSELHNLLKIHFGQDVIFNQKEEGWYFRLSK